MSEPRSAHTPGPWVTNGFNIFGPVDPKSKHENGRTLVGGVVDDMNDWRSRPVDEPINRADFREERIANAHLIAAAPELLAALVVVTEAIEELGLPLSLKAGLRPALQQANAAIAKAEGRR